MRQMGHQISVLGLSWVCITIQVAQIRASLLVRVGIPTSPFLTVVLQDEVGGLQVMNQGRWVAVKPVEDSFVINVGDPIQILSNGKYKSVEHRIVLNKEKPRISMACFFNPLPEARIAPLAKLLGEDNPPLYKECIYGDYSNNALSKGLDGKSPLGFVTHTCI